MSKASKVELLGMDEQELSSFATGIGERSYRGKQLAEAIYRQRVDSLDSISTLPQPLRSKIQSMGVSVGLPGLKRNLYRRTERFGT